MYKGNQSKQPIVNAHKLAKHNYATIINNNWILSFPNNQLYYIIIWKFSFIYKITNIQNNIVSNFMFKCLEIPIDVVASHVPIRIYKYSTE